MIYFIYIYNTVAPLKLLNDFHRKLIYLCKIYDSPPGMFGMIISIKYMGPFAQTNMSNAISLNSDEQQSHTHHMHVLPPKVKVWISAFVLFQNVDIIFFMFTKCFHCYECDKLIILGYCIKVGKTHETPPDIIVVFLKICKGKSKGRFYIAQRFTLFDLTVHSDTNSASSGSILTMQQFIYLFIYLFIAFIYPG